jgi:hypothetical protein
MDLPLDRPISPGTEKILTDFYLNDNESICGSTITKRTQQSFPETLSPKSDMTPIKENIITEKIKSRHFAGDMLRRTVYNDRQDDVRGQDLSVADYKTCIRTSKRQMKGLQHTQSMESIIQQVTVVHNTVSG